MARASQLKKQPAFDRSELDDLIFSPAVGNGVGSHMLEPVPDDMTTVGMSKTIAPHGIASINISQPDINLSTVAITPSVANTHTVARTPTVAIPTPLRSGMSVWMTEHGDLVPQKRVRPIYRAQDVINPAEENVYNVLWTVQPGQPDFKFVQAGYDYLGKKTRLAKKTIQRIIAKLIEKDFIAVETPADIYQRSSTTYRVFSYKLVLEKHRARGRTHVAKMGPGFSYVSTVINKDVSTVARIGISTVAITPTSTVDTLGMSTVVRETTSLRDRKSLEQTSSSEVQRLREFLQAQIGLVDEEAICRLFVDCESRAGKTVSAVEIISVVSSKLSSLRKARNPVGLLIEAVPKHFPLKTNIAETLGEDYVDDRLYWEGVLENEDAPEGLKQQARRALN